MVGKEVFFDGNDVIVSKTDLKGRLTYVNDIFCNISGFTEDELLGKPHSVIRHHKMPRCIFKLLWDKIISGQEIFAYVVNTCKNGDYYWVFAHVTPSLDKQGNITAFHSNRRVPSPEILREKVIPLYDSLLAIEASHSNRKDGMAASYRHIEKMLEDAGANYDEFVFSLNPDKYL